MGSVAGGGGEEEADNLSAVDMLHDVVDSFAKQPSDEGTIGSLQTGPKSFIVRVQLGEGLLVGEDGWAL